jgi:DNA polymerase III delta prime subunit
MEQDADKTALREALLLQAQQGMKAERSLSEKDADVLNAFISRKKAAIIARAAELTKTRLGARRLPNTVSPVDQPTTADRQAIIEKIEKAQIETQLLQAQINLLQNPLSKAINALATAEFAASDDETQKAKADEARKEYEKIKAKYVEHSKRLQLEQQEVQSMQQMGGMGSFGGMM